MEIKLNDRLHAVDRFGLTFKIGVAQFGLGDVAGKGHDPDGLAFGVKNRVVGGLNPNGLASFDHAFELARVHVTRP